MPNSFYGIAWSIHALMLTALINAQTNTTNSTNNGTTTDDDEIIVETEVTEKDLASYPTDILTYA